MSNNILNFLLTQLTSLTISILILICLVIFLTFTLISFSTLTSPINFLSIHRFYSLFFSLYFISIFLSLTGLFPLKFLLSSQKFSLPHFKFDTELGGANIGVVLSAVIPTSLNLILGKIYHKVL